MACKGITLCIAVLTLFVVTSYGRNPYKTTEHENLDGFEELNDRGELMFPIDINPAKRTSESEDIPQDKFRPIPIHPGKRSLRKRQWYLGHTTERPGKRSDIMDDQWTSVPVHPGKRFAQKRQWYLGHTTERPGKRSDIMDDQWMAVPVHPGKRLAQKRYWYLRYGPEQPSKRR